MKKILFINDGIEVDYLCDCLYHGLCTLDDVYVETITDYWFIYEGNSPEKLRTRYGKGFTITNRVSKEKKHCISEQDAVNKINKHFYDLIIYGSIKANDKFLNIVKKSYNKNEIAFIDGGDSTYYEVKWYHVRTKIKELLNRLCLIKLSKIGLYFKRELVKQMENVYPISFAIPAKNIVNKIPKKEVYDAFVYPGRLETYIYDNEKDYNEGYQKAKFGVTFKKAGWDCMRHYEILANGTIPYFPDLIKCPFQTMANFPKSIILITNQMHEQNNFKEEEYTYYANILLDYTKNFLTTTVLAKYVLSYFN